MMCHILGARKGSGGARALVTSLAVLAFVIGILPAGERAPAAQQKAPAIDTDLASWVQHWFSQAAPGAVRLSIAPTQNFAVYYEPVTFGFPWWRLEPERVLSGLGWIVGLPYVSKDEIPEYVQQVMGELEFAYQRLTGFGFGVPAYAQNRLITVLLVPRSKLGQGTLAETGTYLVLPSAAFITLPNDMDRVERRRSTAHELFHVFQNIPALGGLGEAYPLWILEGTATWAEDEVHAVGDTTLIGYPARLGDFWEVWGRRGHPFSGLPGNNERVPENEALWYGNAVLFKWWTEHLPGGMAVMRDLLRDLLAPGLTGPGSKVRLARAIERYSDTNDFPHELLRASLGAYLLNGPAPYGLRRGATLVSPMGTPVRAELPSAYDAPSGRIAVTTSPLESFAALFRRISAADRAARRTAIGDTRIGPEPLFIAVKPSDRREIRAALVERSTRLPDGGRRVTLLDVRTDEGRSFVVPRFADDLGQTVYVDLVAVNGSFGPARQSLAWSYAVGGPPMLERAEILIGGSTSVYAAEWEQPEVPDRVLSGDAYMDRRRTLNEERNALPDNLPNADRLDNVVVRLRFSKPVSIHEVRLGQSALQAPSGGPVERVDWELRASRVDISAADREAGALELSVQARDRDFAQLDGEPETPAALRPDGTGWIGYEDGVAGRTAGRGGDDRSHRLKLKPTSEDSEAFRPYRLFTFQDAAEVAPGIVHYGINREGLAGQYRSKGLSFVGEAAKPAYSMSELNNNIAAWGSGGAYHHLGAPPKDPRTISSLPTIYFLGVQLFVPNLAGNAPDALTYGTGQGTVSGLGVAPRVYDPPPAQRARLTAEWSAWDIRPPVWERDLAQHPVANVSAEIQVVAYALPRGTLRGAIEYATKRRMAATNITGFDAACRSVEGTGDGSLLIYNAAAGNVLVTLSMRREPRPGHRDFPLSLQIIAERILRIIGQRLGRTEDRGAPFPGRFSAGYDLGAIRSDLKAIQDLDASLKANPRRVVPTRRPTGTPPTEERTEDRRKLGEMKRSVGIELARFQQFFNAIGPTARGFYPGMEKAIKEIEAAGIEPVTESEPSPAPTPPAPPSAAPPPRPARPPSPPAPASPQPAAPRPPAPPARPPVDAPAPPRVPDSGFVAPKPPSLPSPVESILRVARLYDKMPPDAQREFIQKLREVWPKLSPQDRARFPESVRKQMGN